MSKFCYHTLDQEDQCTRCGVHMEESPVEEPDMDGPETFWGQIGGG